MRSRRSPIFAAPEIAPGAAAQSDAALDDFVRENVESAYHPCGTCRMGAADDVNSVVDSECRVIGTQALRVADSSIFPEITNGNLNAPTIMVGEKAADMILGKPAAAGVERRAVDASGMAGEAAVGAGFRHEFAQSCQRRSTHSYPGRS